MTIRATSVVECEFCAARTLCRSGGGYEPDALPDDWAEVWVNSVKLRQSFGNYRHACPACTETIFNALETIRKDNCR